MALDRETRLAIAKWGPKVNRIGSRYGVSGRALLAKLTTGESGGRKGAVSSAGARGRTQFMPSTRTSFIHDFHIDPWRSADEAEHAAALHLLGRGGHGKGLEGYNPGGGRAYINYILGQKVNVPKGEGHAPARASMRTTPGIDRSGDRRALIAQYLLNDTVQTPSTNPLTMLKRSGAGLDKLLALQGQLKGVQDTPSRKVRVKPSGGSGGARRASQRYTGPLRELFWQGQGGVNVKNGTHEPQGFVSGHRDHVHVAANRNTIIKLGTLAQSMGLHVGENPHFGGVHPVHVAGSNHYIGRAIDVSGDPAKMRAYAHKVARIFGV